MRDPIADPRSRHARLLEIMLGAPKSLEPSHFQRAAELGIFPTVRAWLETTGWDVSMSDPGAKRERIALALRTRALHEVVDCIPCTFAVLKGIPLGRELYGDAERRASADIDLLVREADLDVAIGALHSLGYQPQTRSDGDANREVELVHETTGLLVDLHWRIAFPWVPAPETDDLLESLARVRAEGVEIPVLSRTDRLLNLLLHFHDHVGFAKGLLDVAAFSDVHGQDSVDRVMERARELGLVGVCSWPFAVLRELGIDPGWELEPRPALGMWASWSARALPGVLDLDRPIGARHPASFKIGEITRGEQVLLEGSTMALLDRKRDRIRAMSQPILSSPSALARKRGAQDVGVVDWARWAARPASLVARQLRELADRDSG